MQLIHHRGIVRCSFTISKYTDLTTYGSRTTSNGMGISIRTLSIPVGGVIIYNIGSCAGVRRTYYAYISHVRRYPYTRGTGDPRCST